MSLRDFILVITLIGAAFATIPTNVQTFQKPIRIQNREVTQSLYLNNPYDGGKWGNVDMCSDGSFAFAVEIMYNAPNNLDETAINAVKLYCATPDGTETGYVTSIVGSHGKWYGMQVCPKNYITGFRANVLEYQGIFTDDVGVENFEVDCDYGTYIVAGLPMPVPKANEYNPQKLTSFNVGTWSAYATCREGLAVCGLQVRHEKSTVGDEVSTSDVIFFCCSR